MLRRSLNHVCRKCKAVPRNLANALETIHLCAAEKPAAEAAITKFLGEYGRTSATSLVTLIEATWRSALRTRVELFTGARSVDSDFVAFAKPVGDL